MYFKEIRSQNSLVTSLMWFLTDWTSIALYFVYLAILIHGLLGRNRRQVRFVLVFIGVQIFVSAILVQITKMAVGRPRPMPALNGTEHFSHFSTKNSFHSFPSGHTSEITGAAFPLANWFGRPSFSLFLGLIVALIGYSRIYLSMHHLSDVAGGMAAGVFAGLLNHYLCSREQP